VFISNPLVFRDIDWFSGNQPVGVPAADPFFVPTGLRRRERPSFFRYSST